MSKHALFVINQDADFSRIIQIISKKAFKKVIILTPHLLFNNEREVFVPLSEKVQFTFHHYGEFTSDQALEIDKETYYSIDLSIKNHWSRLRRFKNQFIYLRSKDLFQQLSQIYTLDKVYFTATKFELYNLGISYRFHTEIGGTAIPFAYTYYSKKRLTYALKSSKLTGALVQLLEAIIYRFKEHIFHGISHEDKLYIFTTLKRLSFEPNTVIKPITYRPLNYFSFTKSNSKDKTLLRFIRKQEKRANAKVILGTTMSNYWGMVAYMQTPKFPVYIFQDAFRGTNNPVYLYTKIFYFNTFAIKDTFDRDYFTGCDKKVTLCPPFITRPSFITEGLVEKIIPKTVVLSLNCAGDWTGIVCRSDTDILVEAFAKLTVDFPHLAFIIRLHPGMDVATSEGKNSKERIRQFVNSVKLKNISVSSLSLEEDWVRGDIFISEYSLSVLDAMRRGKLGFFVNLTNRRSFIQDFADIGIPHVSSFEDIKSMLKDIIDRPQYYTNQFKKTCTTYNNLVNNLHNTSSLNKN